MYDIKELETEWKKYQSKRKRPFYIAMLFVAFIALVVIILNQNKFDFPFLKSSFYSTNNIQNNEKIVQSNIILNIGLNRLEQREDVVTTILADKNTLVDIPVLNIEHKENAMATDTNTKTKVHLNIIGTSSITAYEDVEKRFLQSRDIDDALFLAKSYYKRLNYDKAVYWAYEVNKIDESLEESVFIFVKSKVKLGQKNEAILLLKSYIKKSNSEAGNILLDKLENDIL